MPQPISFVAPNATIIIANAGDRPLTRHPLLAVLAMEAIASWANVEAFMLRIFIQLFGGDDTLAANVFLALDSRGPKTAAIQAAANTTLKDKPEELKLLQAILAIAKTHEKSRDKLAHWVWGDSPDLPEALLLCDPKSTIKRLNKSEVFVYRDIDFKKIIEDNDSLCGFGLTFMFVLREHPQNKETSLFDELCAEPEIRERLNRPV